MPAACASRTKNDFLQITAEDIVGCCCLNLIPDSDTAGEKKKC